MQITRDFLVNERAAIMERMNVMSGALQTIDQLLAYMDEDEPDAIPEEQLARMVGGNGAVVEKVVDHDHRTG